jgi:nucleotide-binding universal stress UspA family protein
VKRLTRVLCAVAIDERDTPVFAQALALARRDDARLLLLHAASPGVAFNHGAAERIAFLRKLRAMAEAAGVNVRVTVQAGPVAGVVLLHARARAADVIVLGTGRRDTRRGLSGWIAEQVLRDAPCPTLIVPQSSDPAALGDNILCAVDFSPASQVAAREAVRLAGHRPVTLLHVVDVAGAQLHVHNAVLATGDLHRGLAADALTRLQSLIPDGNNGAVVARVTIGQPVPEIVRAAHGLNAQLVVIGAAPRTRIGRRLFGRTGQLLRDATSPVLAVPVAAAATHGTTDQRRRAA